MTSGFEAAISEAMAELEKQRSSLAQLTEGLEHISGAARSKRREVSVTVDARGDITELIFHGKSYKTLPPAELARLIVETIQDAKQAAQEQLWESLGDVMPEGLEFAQTAAGMANLPEAMAQLSLPQPLLDLLGSPPELGDVRDHAGLSEEVLAKLSDLNAMGRGPVDQTQDNASPRAG